MVLSGYDIYHQYMCYANILCVYIYDMTVVHVIFIVSASMRQSAPGRCHGKVFTAQMMRHHPSEYMLSDK